MKMGQTIRKLDNREFLHHFSKVKFLTKPRVPKLQLSGRGVTGWASVVVTGDDAVLASVDIIIVLIPLNFARFITMGKFARGSVARRGFFDNQQKEGRCELQHAVSLSRTRREKGLVMRREQKRAFCKNL